MSLFVLPWYLECILESKCVLPKYSHPRMTHIPRFKGLNTFVSFRNLFCYIHTARVTISLKNMVTMFRPVVTDNEVNPGATPPT